MQAPNVYELTAHTSIAIAKHCLISDLKAGYYTPAQLLGAEFITTFAGVKVLEVSK
jgi:short subunit dehydrogenase-like uncharacterized protein